jgi:nitrate reductase gamma subunit
MRPRVTLTFGGIAAVAVAVGWFLLSHRIAHTDVQTAVSESLGAILVLMLVVSIIGSIRGRGKPE